MVVDAAKSGGATPALELLTDRERQILKLFTQGRCTKDIANRLHLSVKTVGTHRSHIMEKLDIHSIAGLTKFAICEGLTPLEH
jgi:DNA-binding NarL/FixJ family response regulator